MFCAKCGVELKPDDKFCPKCGTQMDERKPEPSTTEAKEPAAKPPPKPQPAAISTPAKPKPKPPAPKPSPLPPPQENNFWRYCLFIFLGVIAALIIGLFAFIWYLKNLIFANIPIEDLQKYLADDQLTQEEIEDIVIKFTDNLDIQIDEAIIEEIVNSIEGDLSEQDLKELRQTLDQLEEQQ